MNRLLAKSFAPCALMVVACELPPPQVQPATHIRIISAQSDDTVVRDRPAEFCPLEMPPGTSAHQLDCPKHTTEIGPVTAIMLQPRHLHRIAIERDHESQPLVEPAGDGGVFEIQFSETDLTTNRKSLHSVVTLRGEGLGVAELRVRIPEGDPQDNATLKVRGVSSHIAVVAWVDHRQIDPAAIAPGASQVVARRFRDYDRCENAVRGLMEADELHMPSYIKTRDDRRYVAAALLKGSGNDPPPPTLSDEYIREGDYRLFSELRITRNEEGKFVILDQKAPLVGRTVYPCRHVTSGGMVDFLRRKLAETLGRALQLDMPEVHPLNGTRWHTTNRFWQINEGRLGEEGQRINKLLSRRLDTDDPTPWIWSAIAIDTRGVVAIATQLFPTYSVYVDGILQPGCEIHQDLPRFLQLDHNSQFTRRNLDPGSREWK